MQALENQKHGPLKAHTNRLNRLARTPDTIGCAGNNHENCDQSDRETTRNGAEPLVGQHHQGPVKQRDVEPLHSGALGTGLTSNPTIFDHAFKNSDDYDDAIRQKLKEGKSGEALFFELALEDLRQAADLFRPIHDETDGVDGWVSLEVSPLLAHDTAGTIAAVKTLHAQAGRPNLFIKIPGTREGLPAIEEATFAGVPVNVTLLFSREQYAAAAVAYQRGLERRIAAGLKPDVSSVASMFISRWDVAVTGSARKSA